MAKKLHWTQKPENKAKLLAMLSRSHKTKGHKVSAPIKRRRLQNKKVTRHPEKTINHTPNRSLLAQFAELKQAASQRITDIDDQMAALDKERSEILVNFPDVRRSSGKGLREVKEAEG